jgi:hypothetical protein
MLACMEHVVVLSTAQEDEHAMTFVQGTPIPVFVGPCGEGSRYLCGHCLNLIARGVSERHFNDVRFRCFYCGKLSLVPARPVLSKTVTGRPGQYVLRTPVTMGAASMVSEAAIDAWTARVEEVQGLFARTGRRPTATERQALVDRIISYVEPAAWVPIAARHARSLASPNAPKAPHRLAQLVFRVEEARDAWGASPSLDKAVAELELVTSLFGLWESDENWSILQRELRDAKNYLHTIALLMTLALALNSGIPVNLHFSADGGRAADLQGAVDATVTAAIELKVPQELAYPPKPVTREAAEHIVAKARKRAGKQIDRSGSNILVIAGFDLGRTDLDRLEAAAYQWLARKPRPHISGLLIVATCITNSPAPASLNTAAALRVIGNESARLPLVPGSVVPPVGKLPDSIVAVAP